MRKKSLLLIATLAMTFSLAACANTATENSTAISESTIAVEETTTQETVVSETEISGDASTEIATVDEVPETITIEAYNGNKELVEVEVPYNPERIAILDMAALDILDNLGLGDRVVGSANTSLDYLQTYVNNDAIENLGTIKEADLEAVMACEPDIIFIGGRLSKSYDALLEIAPVVFLATDSEIGLVESVRKNATTIASIFGEEDQIDEKMAQFDDRIAALAEAAEGKTAVVGMTTSGSFNILGDDGRCSIIGNEIGFDNLGNTVVAEKESSSDNSGKSEKGENSSNSGGTATHGNEASFEVIVELNPDYIFVMDRDAAIGAEGATLAKEIVENELVQGTDAYANGNIVYLANPAVWYTAEGGITALDVMLSDLEGNF